MKNYTVTVNPTKRTVTVDYEGYRGTARCCPTDTFNLTVGMELALERAKNKKKAAEGKTYNGSVMELVKALEKALPKGQMVIVGNGKELTTNQKEWLHSLTDCKGGCSCKYQCGRGCEECEYQYTEEDMDTAVEEAYGEGYADAIEKMRSNLSDM